MKSEIITISGMSCGHCKMAVETAVKNLQGVNRAEVDLDRGSLSVEFADDNLSLEEIKKAVTEAGYTPE